MVVYTLALYGVYVIAGAFLVRWTMGMLAPRGQSCFLEKKSLPALETKVDPALVARGKKIHESEGYVGKRIKLVIGGCGFLGRHVVEELLNAGEIVWVMDLVEGREKRAHKYIVCNFADEPFERVVEHLVGVDDVIHTASLVAMVNYNRLYNNNVVGTAIVLNACIKAGVKTLVYTSSYSVAVTGECIVGDDETRPRPEKLPTHYGTTKALAEDLVLRANGHGVLQTCAVRPPGIFGGAGDMMVPMIRKANPPPRMNSKCKVDFLHVVNVAHGHVQASDSLVASKDAKCAGRAYFLSTNEPIAYAQFMSEVASDADHPERKPLRLNYYTYYLMGCIIEAIHWLTGGYFNGLIFQLTRGMLVYTFSDNTFSSAAATRDFGYKPLMNLKQSIKKSIEDYDASVAKKDK